MPRGAHKAIKPHNPFVGIREPEQVASRNLQNDSLFGSALSTILRIMLGIRFATTLINYLRAGNKPKGIGKIMAKIESRHAEEAAGRSRDLSLCSWQPQDDLSTSWQIAYSSTIRIIGLIVAIYAFQ